MSANREINEEIQRLRKENDILRRLLVLVLDTNEKQFKQVHEELEEIYKASAWTFLILSYRWLAEKVSGLWQRVKLQRKTKHDSTQPVLQKDIPNAHPKSSSESPRQSRGQEGVEGIQVQAAPQD